MSNTVDQAAAGPLESLEAWDDFVKERYAKKSENAFRDYAAEAKPGVREFYRLNHQHQTLDFVQAKKAEFLPRKRAEMSIWEAMEYLNTLVDDSDPDTDLTQIEHLLQTSEAIRADNHPDWFVLTGLIHDLGKILCLWGEPQWAVVGDTFPTGCAWSDTIVFPEFFQDNPDSAVPAYQSKLGIYDEHTGLDKVHLSWGHDEYLYHVVRDYLPDAALAMIRYHSFYPMHKEGAYGYLMNAHDQAMLPWVQQFNPYDLYSKSAARPDVRELRPYYDDLIARYFPAKIRW